MHDSIITIDGEWLDKIESTECPSYKLFTSESYYKSMWECTEHGIIIVDRHFCIIEANPYFAEMIGISSTDLQQSDIRSYLTIRSFNTDTNIMIGLIKGREFSHSTHGKIQKVKHPSNSCSQVQIIITRVPASLINEFQHFVIQVYQLDKASAILGNPYLNSQTWADLIKALLSQEWFVKYCLIGLIVLIILLILSGNLLPVIEYLKN